MELQHIFKSIVFYIIAFLYLKIGYFCVMWCWQKEPIFGFTVFAIFFWVGTTCKINQKELQDAYDAIKFLIACSCIIVSVLYFIFSHIIS